MDSNQDLVEEVSYGILATASTDNHGYGQREMQEIASSYLESNEKVHKICKIQLMPSDKCAAPIVSEVLLQMSEFKFPSVTFSLDRWSTGATVICLF